MNRTDVEKFIHANFGGILQEYPWSDTPNYAVFRHQDTRKWFQQLIDLSYSLTMKKLSRKLESASPNK